MAEEVMLTTIDNPYNPFTQFSEWYSFDTMKGYNTCGLLGRMSLSDYENDENDQMETNKAIDTICRDNVLGVYRKVTRKDFETGITTGTSVV